MPDLGEQALSKVAEVGLASQLDEVETLKVTVQADPLQVVSGTVEGVSIQGEGLVMKQDLRVSAMQIETDRIALNPLSVAFGKIELTQPTAAEALVKLTEADLNRAFNSDYLQAKLNQQTIEVAGQPQTFATQDIQFRIPDDDTIALSASIHIHNADTVQPIAFTATPKIAADGHCVVLENLVYPAGQNPDPAFSAALVAAASELLDLRNFDLAGMSLQIKELQVAPGKLTLRASAEIAQFPG